MEDFIRLSEENIAAEHICCAFSDKKCKQGYEAKKSWLKKQFEHGYTFLRLNERAKVFIEYGPAEYAWMPVVADNYLMINCFWVSGKYKAQGYGKKLLQQALADAVSQQKYGLVTVAGTSKFHFMSDTKWLLKQGFAVVGRLPEGFDLLCKKIDAKAPDPSFGQSAASPQIKNVDGLCVYYSDRCPFCDYYVQDELTKTAAKRGVELRIVKLDTLEAARKAPTPATIFSLYLNGRFITTDISVCLDNRFDKIIEKSGGRIR